MVGHFSEELEYRSEQAAGGTIRGSYSCWDKTFSFLQNGPDQCWAPPRLQFNGFRCYFLGFKAAWYVNLTTQIHQVPKLWSLPVHFTLHITENLLPQNYTMKKQQKKKDTNLSK